jgi:hypothetical protein
MVIEEVTLSRVQSVINLHPLPEEGNGNITPSSGDRSSKRKDISFVRNLSEIFHFHPHTPHDTPARSRDSKSLERSNEGDDPAKLPLRERIRHFTWTWFTMTMATGGIANVL